MGRAVGWFVIVFIVVLMATHPNSLVGLIHVTLGLIQRAGSELSAFVNRLLAQMVRPALSGVLGARRDPGRCGSLCPDLT